MPAFAKHCARLAARWGFDLPKLGHSLWVAIAAFLSLGVAWALGLDHPQWAAITVFVTIQPSRGQTVEKNIYRFIGTLIGSAAGLILLLLANGNVWLISAGLALWSGVCLFFGTLQRAYRSYGTVLAGYSAIIVAMNNTGSAAMVYEVALDRVTAILIGVVAGTALGYLIAPSLNGQEYQQKTRRILADMLRQTSVNLGNDRDLSGKNYALIAAAAELSAQLSTLSSHRAGMDQQTAPLSDLLVCTTNLLMTSAQVGAHPALAERLQKAAAVLHTQSDFTGLHRLLSQALSVTDDPDLSDALLNLTTALPDEDGQDRGLMLTAVEGVNWQYDWRGARQAALRILFVTGAIGAAWAATGAGILQFALISSAIVISLASSGVSPSRAMRDVVIGQVIGAGLALFCEVVLWQRGLGGAGQVLAMAPAFAVYAVLRSNRRISLSATDYALTLLLLLTPTHAAYVQTYPPLAKAVMAVSGGLIGYVAFRYLFPVDATRRRKTLWAMIKAELQAIAEAPLSGRASANAWRLRFVGRFLKIVNWTFHETRGEPAQLTMQKGHLTLALGDLVFGMRRMLRRTGLSPMQRRAIQACLRRISQTDRETVQLVRAISLVRRRLADSASADPDVRQLHVGCTRVIDQLDRLAQHRQGFGASPDALKRRG